MLNSLIFSWPLHFQFSSVQFSHVRLFVTPWIAAHQASLSITNSQSSLRLTSIESVLPSSHLILCRPRLLLPPTPPSIRVFSNESTLCMRWPEYLTLQHPKELKMFLLSIFSFGIWLLVLSLLVFPLFLWSFPLSSCPCLCLHLQCCS